MRPRSALGVTLITAAVLAAAGCGASPAPAPRDAPAPAVTYADPACPQVLANIAGIPADQVTIPDSETLDGVAQPGSTLAGLAGQVSGDLLNMAFDADGTRSDTAADLQQYDADVAQLKSFCGGPQ